MPTIRVIVTFLRQDRPCPGSALPPDASLVRLAHPSVAFYRYMYNTVGAAYVWWLRRTVPDDEIAALLNHPQVSVHVLYRGGEPAGFFELDRRPHQAVNIAYFGLLPHAVGLGLGPALLQAACDIAWQFGPRMVTVNTCTADHRRAMGTYLAAGFEIMRRVPEQWDVPDRLGMVIPAHLRL